MQQPTGTLWPKWTYQVRKGTLNREEKDGHRQNKPEEGTKKSGKILGHMTIHAHGDIKKWS